jgi:CRP-like cAMP-binding protein
MQNSERRFKGANHNIEKERRSNMTEATEIKKVELFAGLSDVQLDKISKITEKKSFQKGAHIYQKGDRAKEMFVVLKGLVSLREINPGDQIGVGFESRERGEVFGAACFMKPKEYTLTAVCKEDVEALSIDADQLFQLCEQDAGIGYHLMTKIAQIYFERYKVAKRQLYQMVKAPTIIMAASG